MTTDAAEGGRYFAADAEADDELARLKLLEALCDPWTFRCLDGIGVRQGWRCLEVGAGAGSVVRWLSERVGSAGRVVAVDLDPRFLGDLRAPNVEVRRCDITQDDIEPAAYDLVHCRALLMHMNDPADVLRRMVAALRPGGWLVAEDADLGIVESLDSRSPAGRGLRLLLPRKNRVSLGDERHGSLFWQGAAGSDGIARAHRVGERRRYPGEPRR